MLSGTGLCDELITRPEESYRLWCVFVCDLETSRTGAPYIYIYIYIYICDISSPRVKECLFHCIPEYRSFTKNLHLLGHRVTVAVIRDSKRGKSCSSLLL